jgi:hypothetical protein
MEVCVSCPGPSSVSAMKTRAGGIANGRKEDVNQDRGQVYNTKQAKIGSTTGGLQRM